MFSIETVSVDVLFDGLIDQKLGFSPFVSTNDTHQTSIESHEQFISIL